ncbi:MAG: dessication-associated protein [Mucilaginibacter sp.]|nr:dessication-associated protein [Mucilaginibacter sp.]
MNLFNIIEEIEKVDPEIHERMSPRRDAIKNITGFGSKVAIAALPFALSTLFKKAYGATPTIAVNTVLNFALQLEYLESYFYTQGLVASGLILASDTASFATISADETEHVAFLKSVLGSAAIPMPAIDLTAKGAFSDVLTNYNTFLAVANTFEDTGVRAYKGQAPNLLGNQVVLTAALSIHAVEARHASVVRSIRASRGVAIAPWITGTASVYNDTGVATVNANYGAGASGYPAENNVIQAGIDCTALPSAGGSTTAFNIACEAFDEPLDMATVLTVVGPFFK